LRAIDLRTPIAVSLDMHANLYDAMIANATAATGYRTCPFSIARPQLRMVEAHSTIWGDVTPIDT